MRYKITIEYLGTDLSGWQRQQNALSVQELIEIAIFKLSGEKVIVHAAGRTDAGVHALGQVGHFDITKHLDPYKVMRGINHFLQPHAVGIVACEITAEDFHARFSAQKRHYLYRISNRLGGVVVNKDRVWHIPKPLDLNSMIQGSKHLIGKHDFTSFRASICQAQSPIKTLDKIDILRFNDEIHFWLSAPSFLHHMVRNIVGTLTLVGSGKWQAQDVLVALESRKREAAGPTSPACGLYFFGVDY